MVSEVLERKIKEFVESRGLRFGEINVRPWGSWDLIVFVPGKPYVAHINQTFGFGYTLDQGVATFFKRVVNNELDSNMMKGVVDYIGQDIIDEVSKIVKEVESQKEEQTTGENLPTIVE